MTQDRSVASGFVILADESAHWKIGGLPQLERIALAIDELAGSVDRARWMDVIIFWKPEIASSARWLPRHPKIKRVWLTESLRSLQPGARILSTRLFLERRAAGQFLDAVSNLELEEPIGDPRNSWQQLSEEFQNSCRDALRSNVGQKWQYLESSDAITACEQRLLRDTAKGQDGPISRFINRPISRAITRRLLKFEVEPTAWTMAIFILPIIAFFFLIFGDYSDVLIGAALFQLYSILDGCDGEIARIKFLESDRGARMDDFLDLLGSILFATGLGIGLFRTRASAYALEGFLCAGAIVANEMFLRFSKRRDDSDSTTLTQSLYPRQRGLIQSWPLSLLGEKVAWWLIQFTKRDVALFIFLLLALCDRSPWILHLWLAVSLVTLSLSGRMYLSRPEVTSNSRS